LVRYVDNFGIPTLLVKVSQGLLLDPVFFGLKSIRVAKHENQINDEGEKNRNRREAKQYQPRDLIPYNSG
jgi:hypothetical protein